jgi:hypothetical protein
LKNRNIFANFIEPAALSSSVHCNETDGLQINPFVKVIVFPITTLWEWY